MKTLLFICLALPVIVFSQESVPADSLLIPADSLAITVVPVIKDTVNVTDSLGHKQGYWMYFGKDFPNSGVASSEILEDGYFNNDQRIGLWYRYTTGGTIKAVMNYRSDLKTKTSAREQFYYYEYHPNGILKRKPVIGSCSNRCDYYHYSEAGELLEIELFDSLCNTTYKLQRIQKGELDSVSVFVIDPKFHEPSNLLADTGEVAIEFDQTGEYCVDYNHRIFRVGSFSNGSFIEGREFVVDEMMRAQCVRYYEGGKMVKVLVR